MTLVGRSLLVRVLALALACDSAHPANGASRYSADGAARTAKDAPKRLMRSEDVVGGPEIAAEISAGGSAGTHVPHGPKFAQDRRTHSIPPSHPYRNSHFNLHFQRTPSSLLGVENDAVEDIETIDDFSDNLPSQNDQVSDDSPAEGPKVDDFNADGKPSKKRAPGQGPNGPAGPQGDPGDPGKASNPTEEMPAVRAWNKKVVQRKQVIWIVSAQLTAGLLAVWYFSGMVNQIKSHVMKNKLAEAGAKAEAEEEASAAVAASGEGEGNGEGGGDAEENEPPDERS